MIGAMLSTINSHGGPWRPQWHGDPEAANMRKRIALLVTHPLNERPGAKRDSPSGPKRRKRGNKSALHLKKRKKQKISKPIASPREGEGQDR